MLTVAGLDAWYGKSQVLRGVDLEVGRGEIVAILGRNGAGRSTALKAIMGGVVRTGRVVFNGTDIIRHAPHAIARLGLGYVPEDRAIFPDLTTLQNLLLGEKPRRARAAGERFTLADAYSLFPRLEERASAPAGALSGGAQQMLAICRTMMGCPALVMVDEPTEGLAPAMVERVRALLETVAARGTTILLVEQNANLALEVSRYGYVLETGRVILQDASAALRANEQVRHAYLGAG